MNEHGTILNPSAVGNPDGTPVVQVSPALARLMGRCSAPAPSRVDGECGGVNGFHADDCERAAPLCGMRKPGGTTTCIEPAGHAGPDGRGESHGDGSVIRWIYR